MIDTLTHKINVDAPQEAQIIESAKNDPSAFEPLYREYYPRIFRFILNRVGDKDTTADLTSQVFLQALRHLKTYEQRGLPFSSWLFRIAVNGISAHFRKANRTRYVILDKDALDRLSASVDPAETGHPVTPELMKKVFKLLRPEEVALVEMRFFEQMSFRTIGEILSITENNAKVKLYRLLARVKKELKK